MENRLKNEIVGLIAAGVMVKRSSINVLHPSPKYIEKTVSQLYSDGVIRRAPGKVLRLGEYLYSMKMSGSFTWRSPAGTAQAMTNHTSTPLPELLIVSRLCMRQGYPLGSTKTNSNLRMIP